MTLVLQPGRLIRFGPDWPESEATLAFDAASGDFWVLSSLGRFVVERLLSVGPQSESQLYEDACKVITSAELLSLLPSVVASLLDAGILQHGQGVTA